MLIIKASFQSKDRVAIDIFLIIFWAGAKQLWKYQIRLMSVGSVGPVIKNNEILNGQY